MALALDGSGNLYAAGYFTEAGGVSVNYVAKWDGQNWSPLGAGMDNVVSSLAVVGDDLYAGEASPLRVGQLQITSPNGTEARGLG